MMRKKLPADRAIGAQKSMEKPQWRATALALATAVLFGVSAPDASALGLGRVTVLSALGEPLRAEVEIPEITAEELASLRATVASPEAFRTAGLDYNPAMANIQVVLQRRPDGRQFLRLSSARPINEPFIDLLLEAKWASGSIVRDYTMLFDPPNLRQGAATVAAQVSPPVPAPSASVPQAIRPSAPAPAPSREPAISAATAQGKQVKVQSGDTAGRIAAANKPTSVSLDQMLIALLRGNPDAFIGGNVNRLKAGAVLQMPTPEEVEMVPSGEARQDIIAQSRDFNDFRRRLAEGVPATAVGGGERQASGRVQAQVEEKKGAAPTPDKLTLSKGAIQGKSAADKIARERAAQDDAARVAELNKNISDLNKLGTATAPTPLGAASAGKSGIAPPPGIATAVKAASSPAAAPSVVSASAAGAASAPTAASISPAASAAAAPALVASAAPLAASAPAAPASADASASTAAQSAASAAVAAATPAPATSKPRPAPPPPPQISLVDDLLDNPIVPASLGGVLALLLGFGFYRARQRKKSAQVDSSFLESRLQPDSFFGASGGQRVDTNESNATGSSMVYSPSQLDAAGDVDPVAEADVYLAYGRDLQAEEILKEAMRTTPQRVAVHSKLLEIYSKRRDTKAFELVATEAHTLTRGEGPEWEHICELGRELDAGNSLYRPGGHPGRAPVPAAADNARAQDFGSATTQVMPNAVGPDSLVDLDLDLDFSIGDEPPNPGSTGTRSAAAAMDSQPAVTEPMPSLDMDFGSATAAGTGAAVAELAATEPAHLNPAGVPAQGVNVAAEPAKTPAPKAVPAPAADTGMIEFDLGALSLDLDSSPKSGSAAPFATSAGKAQAAEAPDSSGGGAASTAGLEFNESADPLATKLALAQEFNAIGDPDGARSLAEEVLAEASGDLKQKAKRFLAEIA